MHRVLLIGLDGFEVSLAETMMSEGLLPHLSELRSNAVRFRLDHGDAKYSGLAWEHFSSGRSPEDGGRSSAVSFDPADYRIEQRAGTMRPFVADLPVRTTTFDLPYCDLSLAPNVLGIANWGAHDPGVAAQSRPNELCAELEARFGTYPAKKQIYGLTWPSAAKTRKAAQDLERAVRMRTEAATWVLGTRLRDWDLGIVVVGELHSAVEQFWHGVDPSHPLHGIESGPVAGEGLRRIYCAVDDAIGALRSSLPHTTIGVFAMHGMGANHADLPAMALLPELLYRQAFGKPYMRTIDWPRTQPGGVPLLPEHSGWTGEVRRAVPWPEEWDQAAHAASTPVDWMARSRRFWQRAVPWTEKARQVAHAPTEPLGWMPAVRYRQFWPLMPAFALPAFYDGRIRINLAGREAAGLISPERYATVRGQLVQVINECRDAITGHEVVDQIRTTESPALDVGPYDADIHVRFRGTPAGLTHPTLGVIGPLPYRRTGGHTGPWGFLYMAGNGLTPAAETIASSFDVVPTAIARLGISAPVGCSGKALLHT